ncbi:YqcI/YcgG family protein [Allokutzneria sp. A3M-2-11 16]|uniref:guanitoxin biosynthesis heme-dependent pre-guanitoxin N-hydroxylase GntA n=1 Tax=Allokutzneria sp. A3M-2-11 16 TaxID=2962043 RepID=UPI0020B6AEFA|nr:guanitoxin biosynthesis heme-dependent pre-guanitoxin N-hydroxylase GntA [Allokutzneria sp. A3M-2-11 16]MCP3799362.1 YqcI/YcgG family protein [Allokutzneria sp. A3M-2-11 16]
MSAPRGEVRAELDQFLHSTEFSCLGARAAFKRGSLTHHHYPVLGDPDSARLHHEDLLEYALQLPGKLSGTSFLTFVATFDGPGPMDELAFERTVWRHLQLVHDIDSRTYGPQPGASSDPTQQNFGFHVGAHAFFVAALHPGSSRATRRFSRPALAITSNQQFMALGEKFVSLQERIRAREVANNGSVNPSFTHYEYAQPARHFSGRLTEPDWQCPYRSRHHTPLKAT